MAITGGAVMVAATLTNGLAYLVPMLGARHLDPADLSTLATVQALVTIAGVAATGLQTAIAVHRARQPHAATTRVVLVTAAVTGAILIAATPLTVTALHLPVTVVALSAATTLAVVLAAGPLGELQGDQRFLRLAAGMGVLALGRYAGVVVGLVLGGGLVGSLTASVATAWLAVPILHLLARSRPATSASAVPRPATAGPVSGDVSASLSADGPVLGVRKVVTASGATLAMLVASYADLILARQLLPPAESGAYSVGTVLTKGALWAPQVVTVLALPRMARRDSNSRARALAVVAACGAALVAASTLAGGLAFRLAGGPDYAALGRYAPFFAATGALYAVAFVLINAQLATGARWPSAPLWAGAGALVVVAVFLAPHTFVGVMGSALAAAVATTLALTVLAHTATGRRQAPSRLNSTELT
ncbi:polysaccharide biosynthesis protein [Micromonospora costi]|uniref:Polysaccharide biosynthesis protein n=1 Tax=Micromonospora costi TaxID=1530042 RepID=A0A3B0A202_9ACTN|nr:polysaccharide biosynthesis protein [Micromonospora costi]RKN54595.1 polysaccharide biosynthesis protein [Micromonospora costi]